MTDDSAVTGHAAEGLETDRRAVDQLGSPDPIRQRVDVGHEVQRVAIGIGARRLSVELSLAGPNEIEQRIDPTLSRPCGHGFDPQLLLGRAARQTHAPDDPVDA